MAKAPRLYRPYALWIGTPGTPRLAGLQPMEMEELFKKKFPGLLFSEKTLYRHFRLSSIKLIEDGTSYPKDPT